MSTRYAVLGELVRQRGYGYELLQRLQHRMGPASPLNPSSIYSALDSLEQEGSVRSSFREADLSKRERQLRVMYDVTPTGVARWERWLSAPVKVEPLRSELALKVAISRPEDALPLLGVIDEYERACLDLLAEHSQSADAALGRPGSWRLTSVALAHERGTRLLNAEIEWVRDLRRSVKEMRRRSLRSGRRGGVGGRD